MGWTVFLLLSALVMVVGTGIWVANANERRWWKERERYRRTLDGSGDGGGK